MSWNWFIMWEERGCGVITEIWNWIWNCCLRHYAKIFNHRMLPITIKNSNKTHKNWQLMSFWVHNILNLTNKNKVVSDRSTLHCKISFSVFYQLDTQGHNDTTFRDTKGHNDTTLFEHTVLPSHPSKPCLWSKKIHVLIGFYFKIYSCCFSSLRL